MPTYLILGPKDRIYLVFMEFPYRTGKFDLEVTTFQMAVLFCWENRREDKISLENLRLATGQQQPNPTLIS